MLLIKNAAPADIALIRTLTMQVWPQTYTPILGDTQVQYMLNRFYAPEVLEQQMNSGQQFIICYADDQPSAFAAFEKMDPDTFKLHKIYILPEHQGKGIGKFIIRHIADHMSSIGANRLRLNVNRYNYPAIAFYNKAGFVNIGDEDIDIGNGYFMNDHILELTIS